ncbi:hypothetical protein NC652_037969 [Populus alba x Populus x berolinensis]|nr:hypothetical protein NC652_037969 [Populus alba x Populus x berolinensis]
MGSGSPSPAREEKNTGSRFYLGIFYICLKHSVLSTQFVLLSTDVRSGNSGSHGAGVAVVRAAAEVALEMGVAIRLVMGLCGLPCLGRCGRRRGDRRRRRSVEMGGAPLVFVKAKWVSACEGEREIMAEGLWRLRRRWVVGSFGLAGTPC